MARDSHAVHLSIKAVELFISKNAQCSESRNDQYVLMCNNVASLVASPVRGFVVSLFPTRPHGFVIGTRDDGGTHEVGEIHLCGLRDSATSISSYPSAGQRAPLSLRYIQFSVLSLSSHHPGHPHRAPNPYSPSLPSSSFLQNVTDTTCPGQGLSPCEFWGLGSTSPWSCAK